MTAGAAPGGEEPDAGLELATDRTWELLGSPFRIACTSATTGRMIDELLAAFPAAAAPAPAAHRFVLVDGCRRHGRDHCIHAGGAGAGAAVSDGARDVLSWLLTTVNQAAIDGFSGLAVHAGVLASDGRAIALPAPSGTGKTTLTAAGLLAGFEYVSDEALAVDFGSRQLVAYPRALALSSWSRSTIGLDRTEAIKLGDDEVAFPPQRLGSCVAAPPLELAHVVRPVRRPGPTALVAADRSETVGLLLERSFNHYKRPAQSYELTCDLARRAGAWRLEYDDPVEAAATLLDRLSG